MGEFRMPSLGADMEAGTLIEWKIKPGDHVKKGDIVAVVETQKGAIDVEIFEDGTVTELRIPPGSKVPVGEVLATLDGATGRAAPAAAAAPAVPVAAEVPATAAGAAEMSRSGDRSYMGGAVTQPGAGTAMQPSTPASSAMTAAPTAGAGRVRASPAAKSAAKALGVALENVHGTGPGGAITREDVEHAATAAKATPKRPAMRQAIAAAMAKSKREIPHYYLSDRIEVSRALAWLEKENAPKPTLERILPLVLWLKATAIAARKVPEVNGYFKDGVFQSSATVHLGVAIALREGGLITPALHDVTDKPLDVLMRELTDLIERTRRGQLRSSELSDATLTVTSLGERGVESVFGVIFPPQVAIVGFGRVGEEPRIVEGRCEARPMMTATLAADHRVSDGHRGGLFLSEIAALLQKPEAL